MDDEMIHTEANDAALVDLWRRGQAAWPDVALEVDTLTAYLRERVPAGADVAAWARGIRAADVFLACACVVGAPPALRAFEAKYLTRMDVYLRALRPTAELVADTKQELLEKLFVGTPAGSPKIRRYAGRGSLEGWVRIMALGTAVDLIGAEAAGGPRVHDTDEIARGVAPDDDPELALIKASYRGEFLVALRETMSSLSHRERNLLRFTFVDGMTPARIAAVYGVHRTTAMRWVEATQGEVMARTRARLMERLRLSPEECAGLFTLVQSGIHLTLSSLLKSAS
jgi:RNA polymerase sigma-70 factor (ECF subfamily)